MKNNQCVKCNGDNFKYYHGCLGYEAYVCRKCGTIYDHKGMHKPETDKECILHINNL